MRTLPKHVYKQIVGGHTYYRHRPTGARLPCPTAPDFALAYASIVARQPSAKGLAAVRYAVSDSLPRARRRAALCKVPFGLSEGFIRGLMEAQGFACAVSGIEFDLFRTGARPTKTRLPFRPSIDRIEPAKGYVEGNVRLVCFAVNMALSDYGDDVFHEIVRATAAKARNGR